MVNCLHSLKILTRHRALLLHLINHLRASGQVAKWGCFTQQLLMPSENPTWLWKTTILKGKSSTKGPFSVAIDDMCIRLPEGNCLELE